MLIWGGVYRVVNSADPRPTHPDDGINLRTLARFDEALRAEVILTDGCNEMKADINMEGNRIRDLGRPGRSTDGCTKQYVDEVDARLRRKLEALLLAALIPPSVFVATPLEITVSKTPVHLSPQVLAGSRPAFATIVGIGIVQIAAPGLYQVTLSGMCVRPPTGGDLCPEGYISLSHTLATALRWSPIGGDRNISFSRVMFFHVQDGELKTLTLEAQKTNGLNPLNVSLWLVISMIA